MPETVEQGYLEIREVETKEVVAAIELLSPTNKRPGKGRETYEKKRQQGLLSQTHLVEIDLLLWEPMPFFGNGFQSSYRILVARSDSPTETLRDRRLYAELYAFNLPDAIPSFPLSMAGSSDLDPAIDLQRLLNNLYDERSYDLRLDYSREPVPSLSVEDAAWADARVAGAGNAGVVACRLFRVYQGAGLRYRE